jgi:superfamily II DNA helicase RecQ
MAAFDVIDDVLRDFDIKELKPEQREILNSLSRKKDCLAVLPTGFGKSLPFQV